MLKKPVNGLINRFSRTFDSPRWKSTIFCCCSWLCPLASASQELPISSDINTIAISICLIILRSRLWHRSVGSNKFCNILKWNDIIFNIERAIKKRIYMIRNLKVKTGTQATHRHIINMKITVKDGLVSDSLIVSIVIQSFTRKQLRNGCFRWVEPY